MASFLLPAFATTAAIGGLAGLNMARRHFGLSPKFRKRSRGVLSLDGNYDEEMLKQARADAKTKQNKTERIRSDLLRSKRMTGYTKGKDSIKRYVVNKPNYTAATTQTQKDRIDHPANRKTELRNVMNQIREAYGDSSIAEKGAVDMILSKASDKSKEIHMDPGLIPLIQACAHYVELVYTPFESGSEENKFIWFGDTKEEKDPTGMEDIADIPGEGLVQIINPDYSGFVTYNESFDAIFVVFRGTNDLHDTAMDIGTAATNSMLIRTLSDLTMHSGFLRRYETQHDSMWEALTQMFTLHPYCKKIICCGHSLGGANAQAAAIDIARSLPHSYTVDLITYESPRLFTAQSKEDLYKDPATKDMLERSIRIWFHNDPVPSLPPYDAGFRHIGNSYRIKPAAIEEASVIASTIGAHRHPSEQLAATLDQMTPFNYKEFIELTTGAGKKTPKKKRGGSSIDMKKRMAYVRSFKKK